MDAWFSISTTVDSEDEEEVASKAVEARLRRRREIEEEKESRKRKKREAVLASIDDDDTEEKEEEDDNSTPPLPAFFSEAAQHERLPAFFSEAVQRERLPAFYSEAAQRERLVRAQLEKAVKKAQRSKKVENKDEDIFAKIRIVRSEKRLQRFRGTPSSAVRKRINRAKTQRLYMITWKRRDVGGEFIVLGSTGNVYNVTIGHVNSCSCPDARKGNLCKHQLFVLLKVLQEPSHSPIVWQRGFTDRELDILFRRLDELTKKRTLCIHAIATDAVKRAYDQSTTNVEVKQRPLSNDSECPICCEKLVNDDSTRDEPVVWCKNSCGNSVHAHCMQMWITQKQRSSPGSPVPCPFCRAAWPGTGTPTNNNSEEGYLNLASQSGQSRSRPSYTPYNWRRSWKRRRRY